MSAKEKKVVKENLEIKSNIAYFYGSDNLVLTDLLLGLYKEFSTMFPNKKIVLCTGEQFINDLIQSIREGTIKEFREKYRNSDILLIDDIKHFEGRQSCMEELYHTLKEIYINGRQIVVTSDVKPSEMLYMDECVINLLSKGSGIELRNDAKGKRTFFYEQYEISEGEILQMFKNQI